MYIYSYENLKSFSQTGKSKQYFNEIKNYYDANFKDKPIYNLSFSNYKLFFSEGDRKTYETAFFARREYLSLLQVLALFDDAYIEQLEEIMAAICDEFTWVVPAHVAVAKIDLFASETARMLAETVYIFGDKLSTIIQERVKESIYQKIVQPYENNSFSWDNTNNNWGAVCSCGVGLAYLYLYPERFETIKLRLFEAFKSFLSGFDDEGYCYEGVNYWQYGFSNFCVFFNVYEKLKNIRPEFIDSTKVKRVLQYLQNAKMSEDVYLPFADGGYPTWAQNPHYAYSIKSLYPNDFKLDKMAEIVPMSKGLGLYSLYAIEQWDEKKNLQCKEESIYYSQAQVFIRKREKYSFAVKGGCNEELHNHNDVGAFQIVKNNKRVICDFGAGIYTKEYFGTNEQRYKIFACNSLSHSVPIVDDELQAFGSHYAAKILSQDENSIVMDIADAYRNGVDCLKVEYKTEKDFVSVKYHCVGVREKTTFHFVSDCRPIVKPTGVWIENMQISCNLSVQPKIEERKEMPHSPERSKFATMQPRNVYLLDYEVCGQGEIEAEFIFYLGDENNV